MLENGFELIPLFRAMAFFIMLENEFELIYLFKAMP